MNELGRGREGVREVGWEEDLEDKSGRRNGIRLLFEAWWCITTGVGMRECGYGCGYEGVWL